MKPIAGLSASDMADGIANGGFSAEQAAGACLGRADETEPEIQAWAHLDRDHALNAAKMLDAHKQRGLPLGPLHGVPVGLKDIVDTAGMPTENGTPVDAGRRPREDAAVVRRLKRAGAVVLGKTVTTELAYFHPGKTRNPHNPEHTPGGSSSGSAAAVAAGVVPLAIGTQTNGSMIRPASFCGVVGFKPSFGAIPRTGVMEAASSLDTIGIFARSVTDAALAAEAVFGADGVDAAAFDQSPGGLLATATAEPPVRPAIGFVGTPAWDRAEPATKAAFEELCAAIGDVDEVPLPEPFDGIFGWHKAIMAAEMANSLGGYVDKSPELMSDKFKALVADGRSVSATDYLAARNWQGALASGLDAIFERYDAILTPAAPGEAPKGLETTGDPCFCTLWTFCGTPAVTLPLMTGEAGLPMGAQLVGPKGDDARLLRTANWLVRHLADNAEGGEA